MPVCTFNESRRCTVCHRLQSGKRSFRMCKGKPGLGDYVARGLAAIGITKQRVSKALGRPCGCPKRQQKLNDIGRKFGIG